MIESWLIIASFFDSIMNIWAFMHILYHIYTSDFANFKITTNNAN
jgi:hypothetical protein